VLGQAQVLSRGIRGRSLASQKAVVAGRRKTLGAIRVVIGHYVSESLSRRLVDTILTKHLTKAILMHSTGKATPHLVGRERIAALA